jgi:hypothetical protein
MMKNKPLLSAEPRPEPGLNIDRLKQQAVKLIQQVAQDTWTDHNPHDPGITLLEVLCFVITDLSYRLSFPLSDLLQPATEEENLHYYWTDREILPSSPVTSADWQRLIIDFEGVKKAWVATPQNTHGAMGLKDIFVEAQPWLARSQYPALAQRIRKRVISERNVGDDIHQIVFLPIKKIAEKMNLDLEQGSQPETVVLDVIRRLQNTLSPSVSQQHPSDLHHQGLSGETIYDGPLLKHGVIQIENLTHTQPVEKIFASDLMVEILQTRGVRRLTHLELLSPSVNADSSNTNTEDNAWSIDIDQQEGVSLDVNNTVEQQLLLYIDGHRVYLDNTMKERILSLTNGQITTALEAHSEANPAPNAARPTLDGRYRHLKKYQTLQKEFPQIYGLSSADIAQSESPERRAQIRQLQGFLLLFDQILANQFSQLEHIRVLLSLPNAALLDGVFKTIQSTFTHMLSSQTLTEQEVGRFWSAVQQLPQTHTSQTVNDLQAISTLLGDYFSQYQSPAFNELTEPCFSKVHLDRLYRNYAHLLARYHEEIADANILKYPEVIRHYIAPLKAHWAAPVFSEGDPDDKQLLENLVSLKQVVDMAFMLHEYPTISRGRSGGYNYLAHQSADGQCCHGGATASLARRLYRLLGMDNPGQRSLSIGNKEGFHLLEDVLLRHRLDPDAPYYSNQAMNQIYFVLPQWPSRFANEPFKRLLHDTLMRETPMHLMPVVLFLDRYAMSLFDRVYNAWVNAMTQIPLNIDIPNDSLSTDPILIDAPASSSADQTISLDLVRILSGILYEFCQTPEQITQICLLKMEPQVLKDTLRTWQSTEVFDLTSEQIEWIFEPGLSASARVDRLQSALAIERIYNLCQLHLDEVTKPYPINHEAAHIGSHYRVGYRAIEKLNPVYPLALSHIKQGHIKQGHIKQSPINPSQRGKKSFAVAVSEPNLI